MKEPLPRISFSCALRWRPQNRGRFFCYTPYMPSALYEEIFTAISHIPSGHIASYSQVAIAIGKRRGARIVGWALGTLPAGTQVPWWRVVNAKRQLSIVNKHVSPEEQRHRLEAEGRTLTWNGGMYEVSGADWWPGLAAVGLPVPDANGDQA